MADHLAKPIFDATLRLVRWKPPPHSSVLAVKWLATNFGFSQNFPRFE